ncbi:hypothetical protein CR513_34077, partial [Mucuna pruriens]
MTPVLGRGEEVGESCAEDWGLNLNRFGDEERRKEGFVQGRESVIVVIGVWIRFSVNDHYLFSLEGFDSGGPTSFIAYGADRHAMSLYVDLSAITGQILMHFINHGDQIPLQSAANAGSLLLAIGPKVILEKYASNSSLEEALSEPNGRTTIIPSSRGDQSLEVLKSICFSRENDLPEALRLGQTNIRIYQIPQAKVQVNQHYPSPNRDRILKYT